MSERNYDGMAAAIEKAEAGRILNPAEQKLFDEAQRLIRVVRTNQPLAMLDRIAKQTARSRGIQTDGNNLQQTMDEIVRNSPLSQAAAGILERLTNNS